MPAVGIAAHMGQNPQTMLNELQGKNTKKVSHISGNSVDLHPGKAFCPAPGAWMPVFW